MDDWAGAACIGGVCVSHNRSRWLGMGLQHWDPFKDFSHDNVAPKRIYYAKGYDGGGWEYGFPVSPDPPTTDWAEC